MCQTGTDWLSLEARFIMTSPTNIQARLPQLDFWKFSRKVTDWITFWNLYSAAVHRNNQLSALEQFWYFRSLLTNKHHPIICFKWEAGDQVSAPTILEQILLNHELYLLSPLVEVLLIVQIKTIWSNVYRLTWNQNSVTFSLSTLLQLWLLLCFSPIADIFITFWPDLILLVCIA